MCVAMSADSIGRVEMIVIRTVNRKRLAVVIKADDVLLFDRCDVL